MRLKHINARLMKDDTFYPYTGGTWITCDKNERRFYTIYDDITAYRTTNIEDVLPISKEFMETSQLMSQLMSKQYEKDFFKNGHSGSFFDVWFEKEPDRGIETVIKNVGL